MVFTRNILEFVFSFALFVNALLFIPQAIRILREKKAESVSLMTFLGFLLIQFAVILHGIIIHDYLLVLGYLFSMVTCGSVVALIIFYNKRTPLLDGGNITLKEIIDQLPGHVYWKNKMGVCLGCNTNNWKDFGLKSLTDYVGKTDYDLFSKAEANHLRVVDEEVMRTGKLMIVEEPYTASDGKKILYLSHKAPLRDKNNQIVGVIGTTVDITETKQETTDRLEMLENIIAVMPGNVYWMNTEGVYLGCNENEAKAVGLSSRKEIVGKRNVDIPGFVIPQVIDKINQEVMRTGKAVIVEEPAILEGTDAIFLSNKVPLSNAHGEIVGMVGISFDITERKKTEQELKAAKDAAETASKAKTEFLYNMRHDLRTPFSGILGIAEFLESSETNPEKKQNLGYITESAKVLLNHLNEIFEFINTENGQFPILAKQFDLHKLLTDTSKMMLPFAKDKGISFLLEGADNLPKYVIGDQVRTQRILMNLVSNAIKFTQKGYVKLSPQIVKEDDQKVIIKLSVEDTGVGIPEDKRDIIFEQFNRLTSSYSGIYPGKGLGLKMVKQFLDEIGGEIHLDTQMDKGSIFKVLIPYKRPLLNCPEEHL